MINAKVTRPTTDSIATIRFAGMPMGEMRPNPIVARVCTLKKYAERKWPSQPTP